MAFLKSLIALSAWRVVEGLAPGDCAFVGIYGDNDDFALVLMEDADGEKISLTEGSPADADFHVDHWAAAKHYVSDAKRGSVLKKSDFHTDSFFTAPMALTAFTGNADSPTVLCSIVMEEGHKPVARQLDDASVVMLGSLSALDTLEYSGPTKGSKAELLEKIAQPTNWLPAHRRLAGFSIASGNATTTMTATTTMVNNDDGPASFAAGTGSVILGAFMVLGMA